MAMTRLQLKYRQMQARYEADTKRPPTRAQARAWLQPLRDAFGEMRTGEVDAVKGYAVGEFNMYWISPYFTTQIPILGAIKPLVPYPVFVVIYILGFVLLATVVLLAAIGISKIKPSEKFALIPQISH